jgi:hypothetical protein
LSAAALLSVIRTAQPARANTIAQERPINPAPMIPTLGMLSLPAILPRQTSSMPDRARYGALAYFEWRNEAAGGALCLREP